MRGNYVSSDKQSMAAPQKRTTEITKSTYFLTVAIVMVVGFIAGTRSNEILGAVAPLLGFKVETGTLDLRTVQNTYQKLKANYDGTLDEQKLIDGASRGLVEAAGDPYTVFMDASEAKTFEDDISGKIGGGIGAEIGERNGQPTIVRILEGNPAEQSGLKKGDVIIGVNDESTRDMSSDKTADKIRGEVGTTVKITVKRDAESKEFTITRATVNNPSVRSEVKNGIGIMTISRFDDETGNIAQKAAQQFKEQQVRGVILDLRDNGGGYLTAAQDVAGIWLKNKLVVTERVNGQITDELKSGSSAILSGIPTVVLVNGSSASASEIVAGALKDYSVATLIGEKTFGKGTVQQVLDLGAGTKLKVTIARWFTPNGKNISKEGIAPNKEVKMSAADVNAGRDPQLNAALAQFK